MLSKTVVCIYTEGATDKVFYDRLLEFMKTKSQTGQFAVDQIIKQNIAGIGNFKNKLLNKFNKEVCRCGKYKGYKKVVVLCYDEDVFDLVSQTPPIDRKRLHKDLIDLGADKVVHIVAKKSIEDIFLLDIDSVLKYLGLPSSAKNNLSGSGYQKLRALYKKADNVYLKGANVEKFVYELDMNKICSAQCDIFSRLCSVILDKKGCNS